ncbi:DNA alkylation repair enzyme [Geranomyces variabilis]|nr:DNA alkylation repair enzyme [Geranomyces variabilis]KAJ3136315.1 hypothetical protein HDU90_003367 [Geranomyces variabilis]
MPKRSAEALISPRPKIPRRAVAATPPASNLASLSILISEFEHEGSVQAATRAARFFKTGPGQYGEGDQFLGITVPVTRTYARRMLNYELPAIKTHLLESPYHEKRLLGWLAVTQQFQAARKRNDEATMLCHKNFYLANTATLNNWDLVDSTADKILGVYLHDHAESETGAQDGSYDVLTRLARAPSLWERRIAIIATFHFIRMGATAETLRVAALLLSDTEDLIHKAVGWMLREAHKRDAQAVDDFLVMHARDMPRTMLRYTLERFDADRRRHFMMLK